MRIATAIPPTTMPTIAPSDSLRGDACEVYAAEDVVACVDDEREGEVSTLVPGLTSPKGIPSDGKGCPGASMYCAFDASCLCVASDTESFC